ncbi:hypothetical protein BGZ99_008257 [Dissophora globulifera]|uniref:RING-type domain-containing protein n=1 Tax=Dissophora globulifera TaxID=979702 RepID=A0A9P6RS78_9FUNG|nr:hypothetical protein BGZ99_008257 [Dissophora globulifera]
MPSSSPILQIEEANDPRTFVEPLGENDGDDTQDNHNSHEVINVEDLLLVIQSMLHPPRTSRRRRNRSDLPGEFPSSNESNSHSIRDDSARPYAAMARRLTRRSPPPHSRDPSPSRSRDPSPHSRDPSTTIDSIPTFGLDDDGDIEMVDAPVDYEDEDEYNGGDYDMVVPSGFIESLLERIASNHASGRFLDTIGNPGDYVYTQSALDDVITQMMEMHARQGGPVGAPDNVIDNIPHHTLTNEELDAKTECSVCKDEFVQEDICLQLKCRHIFHEDCIKPWLKTSGTCPTCRFAVVPQTDQEEESHTRERSEQSDMSRTQRSARALTDGSNDSSERDSTSMRLPGSFPSSRQNSGSSSSSSRIPDLE